MTCSPAPARSGAGCSTGELFTVLLAPYDSSAAFAGRSRKETLYATAALPQIGALGALRF